MTVNIVQRFQTVCFVWKQKVDRTYSYICTVQSKTIKCLETINNGQNYRFGLFRSYDRKSGNRKQSPKLHVHENIESWPISFSVVFYEPTVH